MRLLRHGLNAGLLGLVALSCGGADQSGLTGGGSKGVGSAASSSGGDSASGSGGAIAAGTGGAAAPAAGGGSGTVGAPCETNADCAPFFCESIQTLRCVECLSDANCPGGACRAGACEAKMACASDANCTPDRPRCNLGASDCVQCLSSIDCGGQACVANRCTGPVVGPGGAPGAGGFTGFGGDPGFGGESPFGSGGVPGEGGALGGEGGQITSGPDGAWKRCRSDADCTGNRTCTYAVQQVLAPGRDGACVSGCLLGAGACDPILPGGGTLQCTVFTPVGAGVCSIVCGEGESCPTGLECVNGVCYWAK